MTLHRALAQAAPVVIRGSGVLLPPALGSGVLISCCCLCCLLPACQVFLYPATLVAGVSGAEHHVPRARQRHGRLTFVGLPSSATPCGWYLLHCLFDLALCVVYSALNCLLVRFSQPRPYGMRPYALVSTALHSTTFVRMHRPRRLAFVGCPSDATPCGWYLLYIALCGLAFCVVCSALNP